MVGSIPLFLDCPSSKSRPRCRLGTVYIPYQVERRPEDKPGTHNATVTTKFLNYFTLFFVLNSPYNTPNISSVEGGTIHEQNRTPRLRPNPPIPAPRQAHAACVSGRNLRVRTNRQPLTVLLTLMGFSGTFRDGGAAVHLQRFARNHRHLLDFCSHLQNRTERVQSGEALAAV